MMKASSRRQGEEGRAGECALDYDECVSLQQILQSFNTTISEEHAWALFHQSARCFLKCLQDNERCFLVSEPGHIYLHKDGTVHIKTLLRADDDSRRREPVTSESQLVVNLALVIYQALDYAHSEDEERLISPDLESLINEMTATEDRDDEDDEEGGALSEGSVGSEGEVGVAAAGAGADTDDEGIERDSEPPRRSHRAHRARAPRHQHRRRRTRRFTLRDVIERCAWHCGGRGGGGGRGGREGAAAAHYRAVCRALLCEALELSSFLARVRVGGARDLGAADDSCKHLDTLRFSDWARFWVQVIGELRMGVKLKKVDFSRTPIEYELTPYEILMDDIRSRRYKLRKVDGGAIIPHRVKKDAHAMILEFIRSRPPLKKASERKLQPLRREETPREQLLASIQRGRPLRPTHPYPALLLRERPVSGLLEPARSPDEPPLDVAQDKAYWGSLASTTANSVAPASGGGGGGGGGGAATRRGGGGGDVTPAARPQRRLIKVDFDNLEDDEDDDLSEVCATPDAPARAAPPQPFPRSYTKPCTPAQPSPKPWKRTASPPRAPPRTRITHDEYHQFCDTTLESYDLATQCPSRRASMRRHTSVACTPHQLVDGSQSVPQSRPGSRQSAGGNVSAASSEIGAAALGSLGGGDLSWSRSSLQDDLIKSVSVEANKQWQDAIMSDDRLSLTLEEIVHIRSVLTKAELEVLPVEGRVKEDVEKRRVCFLCLKTRFGIFGPWGQKCKLCKKTVCQKCYSKMRIPTEHFSNVPVVLLSPSLMPSPEEELNTSFPRSLMARLMSPEQNLQDRVENSVGSAPSSPSLQRGAGAMARSLEGALDGGAGCGGGAARAPLSYVQSAPGSRGGSALGYASELTLPPAGSLMSRSMDGPESMPASNTSPVSTVDRRSRYGRGNTVGGAGAATAAARASERLRGMQMIVCHDCKTMVLQIIKSSRTSRSATRNHAIRNLTLNLSPVYTSNC